MNRLQKLAGINELNINKNINILPQKNWELKSEEYKKFYQLVRMCDYGMIFIFFYIFIFYIFNR